MKNLSFRMCVFLFACISVQSLNLSFGQPESGDSRLELRASLVKDAVEVGEPVVVQIEARNMGDDAVTFTSSVSYNGDLKVVVNRPRRLPHEFLGVETSGVSPDVSSYLKPGDARYYYVTILYDRESESGYLFTEPQTVTLDIQLRYGLKGGLKDQVWKFPPLTVSIVETTEESAQAVRILQHNRDAVALQTFQMTDDTLADFRKALEVTPKESALHPWLLTSLARVYGMSRRENADTMLGLDYANQLLTHHPASHLADDALMLQAVIQDKIGMEDEARKSLIQLYNTYYTSEYISEGNPLFVKYFDFKPVTDELSVSTDPTWMLRH